VLRQQPPTRGRPGEQLSPRAGVGSDFAETRSYQPGDDLRLIDWRASARAGTPLVRAYHAEYSRTSCIVVDRRAGMRFGTRVRLKAAQAARVALSLAGMEARRGAEFAAMLLDDPCHWLPPARGTGGLRRLVAQVTAPCPPRQPGAGEPAWGKVLASLRRRLPRGSAVTLVSDFAGLGRDDVPLLRALGHHATCRAIRVVDTLEREPLPRVAVALSWGDQDRVLDAADPAGADAVRRGLRDWDAFLSAEFRRAGFAYAVLAADAADPLDVSATAKR
jgi:uncharacterized protein (DUF58 family)